MECYSPLGGAYWSDVVLFPLGNRIRGGELRKRLTSIGLQPLLIRPNRAERIHRDRDPNHHQRRIALRAHRLVQQEHGHTELDQRVSRVLSRDDSVLRRLLEEGTAPADKTEA